MRHLVRTFVLVAFTAYALMIGQGFATSGAAIAQQFDRAPAAQSVTASFASALEIRADASMPMARSHCCQDQEMIGNPEVRHCSADLGHGLPHHGLNIEAATGARCSADMNHILGSIRATVFRPPIS